jgi:hypothetical protein
MEIWSHQELELAQAVMAYLQKNPKAMDTSKGIAEWWVEGVEKVDLPILTRVLQHLTRQGILVSEGEREHARYHKGSP